MENSKVKKRAVFDVDGTLITTDDNPKPREDVIALLRAFQGLGYEIYVHSGGGVEYAARWVRHLKLDEERHINIAVKGSSSMSYDIAVDDCIDEQEWTEDKEGKYIKAKYFINV